MAKVLKSFQFGRGGTRQGKYNWNKWLNGQIWQLAAGKDFKVKNEAFLQNAYSKARNRHGKLRTKRVDGGIVIQFYQPTSGEVEAPSES